MPSRPVARARGPLVGAILALVLAGCGGGDAADDPVGSGGDPAARAVLRLPAADPGERFQLDSGVQLSAAGEGDGRVYVARRGTPAADAPVVVFLHGYGSATISGYEPWIAHLARSGATVVFPAWEPPGRTRYAPVPDAFDNVTSAVRAALRGIGRHGPVLVAGLSAGGALAADYAVAARRSRLPAAVAIYAVYPARGLPARPALFQPQRGSIPASTRVVAVASVHDATAGTAGAKAIIGAADAVASNRKRLIVVRDRAVGDHAAPVRDTRKSRQTFWAPLDALIAQVSRR